MVECRSRRLAVHNCRQEIYGRNLEINAICMCRLTGQEHRQAISRQKPSKRKFQSKTEVVGIHIPISLRQQIIYNFKHVGAISLTWNSCFNCTHNDPPCPKSIYPLLFPLDTLSNLFTLSLA